jgi:hypothetical protein
MKTSSGRMRCGPSTEFGVMKKSCDPVSMTRMTPHSSISPVVLKLNGNQSTSVSRKMPA